MQIDDLEIVFGRHPQIKAISERLKKGDTHVLLTALHASARALTLAHVKHPLFVIFDNAEAAQYLYGDLKGLQVTGDGLQVFFFPAAQKRRAVDEAAMIQRTECLTALSSQYSAISNQLIIVTYPEAVAEAVPAKEELSAVSMTLKTGETIQQTKLGQQLAELGFERVDFVFQPGQYAVRGSIVDIYSYSHDNPYRLDFFGDEIDSI